MAEYSGFFESEWDDTLLNPLTEELTGWWDKSYFSEQFAKYFALFVGNGVFINPTNQLIVRPGSGMQVIVSKGFAFINGYWYENTDDKVLDVPLNSMTTSRLDSVRVRWNDTTRKIESLYFSNDISNVRNENFYDLKLAEITIPSGSISVVASNIVDTRPNEDVCGFVRGLMQIETTKDLFAQFESIFNEFMQSIQYIINDTSIARIFAMIGNMDDLSTEDKESLVGAINEVMLKYLPLSGGTLDGKVNVPLILDNNMDNALQVSLRMKVLEILCHSITSFKDGNFEIFDYINNLSVLKWNNKILQSKGKNVLLSGDEAGSAANDFILVSQGILTFTNKQCKINNEKITSYSLTDVYFTTDTINEAEKSVIYVESYNGYIILFAENQPTDTIKATIKIRVV